MATTSESSSLMCVSAARASASGVMRASPLVKWSMIAAKTSGFRVPQSVPSDLVTVMKSDPKNTWDTPSIAKSFCGRPRAGGGLSPPQGGHSPAPSAPSLAAGPAGAAPPPLHPPHWLTLASGDTMAARAVGKSNVPWAMTVCPGRKRSECSLGLVCVWMNMPRRWAIGSGERGRVPREAPVTAAAGAGWARLARLIEEKGLEGEGPRERSRRRALGPARAETRCRASFVALNTSEATTRRAMESPPEAALRIGARGLVPSERVSRGERLGKLQGRAPAARLGKEGANRGLFGDDGFQNPPSFGTVLADVRTPHAPVRPTRGGVTPPRVG